MIKGQEIKNIKRNDKVTVKKSGNSKGKEGQDRSESGLQTAE